MSRYIDADALKQHKFVSWTKPEFFDEKSLEQQAYQLGWNNAIEAIMENEPTADVVSKEKYDELNDRYHRLLESANILADAVRDYERRKDAEIY